MKYIDKLTTGDMEELETYLGASINENGSRLLLLPTVNENLKVIDTTYFFAFKFTISVNDNELLDKLVSFIDNFGMCGSQLCITQVFTGSKLNANIPFNGLTLGSGFNMPYYVNRGADKVVFYFLYTTNTNDIFFFDLKEAIKSDYPEAEEVEVSVFFKKFSEAVNNPKIDDI